MANLILFLTNKPTHNRHLVSAGVLVEGIVMAESMENLSYLRLQQAAVLLQICRCFQGTNLKSLDGKIEVRPHFWQCHGYNGNSF